MRLIDADALKKTFTEECCGCCDNCSHCMTGYKCELIDNAPTIKTFTLADIEEQYCKGLEKGLSEWETERPQGEWIKHIDNLFPEESTEECPFCHEEQILIGNDDNFCPNCGADMRGEKTSGD